MVESTLPKYILHKRWYIKRNFKKLEKVWFSKDIILLTVYNFLTFKIIQI